MEIQDRGVATMVDGATLNVNTLLLAFLAGQGETEHLTVSDKALRLLRIMDAITKTFKNNPADLY